LPNEVFQSLFQTHNILIERIISKGHYYAQNQWDCQIQNEWILLLQGQAKLEFKTPEKIVELKQGDYLLIPSNTDHRVAWTAPETETIWLAVHVYPINKSNQSTSSIRRDKNKSLSENSIKL